MHGPRDRWVPGAGNDLVASGKTVSIAASSLIYWSGRTGALSSQAGRRPSAPQRERQSGQVILSLMETGESGTLPEYMLDWLKEWLYRKRTQARQDGDRTERRERNKEDASGEKGRAAGAPPVLDCTASYHTAGAAGFPAVLACSYVRSPSFHAERITLDTQMWIS